VKILLTLWNYPLFGSLLPSYLLSASEVVFHEEALYQVYVPLPLPLPTLPVLWHHWLDNRKNTWPQKLCSSHPQSFSSGRSGQTWSMLEKHSRKTNKIVVNTMVPVTPKQVVASILFSTLVSLFLHFNGHFARWTWVSWYPRMSPFSIIYIGAKDDDGGGNIWRRKTCKGSVKS